VASSGSRERIRRSLEVTGLAPYFDDRIVSADDVAQGKPAPDLFLLAARRHGVAPASCAVIEDSPAGVTAARAAGMTCLAYAGLTPAASLSDADAVFASMEELPALLGYS
jgi:beta-phosphoglucomutase-like phosphatase (HAD superfamily)